VDVERLYQKHSLELFRFLHRFCGDQEAAADAVQETFLKLLERRPPRGDRIRGWLFRVGCNLVMDVGRTRRRRLRLLESDPVSLPVAAAPPDPEVELERKERRKEVRMALEALKPRDRMVLLMGAEGFTHREIAEAIDVNPKAVGSILNRAQAKLAAALRIEAEASSHGA
jgi:RNA polymerase sigma factor (sigma-70 family)